MEFENYKSVQTWFKELRSRYKDPNEIHVRLELLSKFCEFVAKNPDELVSEVYYNPNSDDLKPSFTCESLLVNPGAYTPETILKKRNFYNEKINEFIEGRECSPSARDNYGNMLEGFFVYNGIRLFRRRKALSHRGGVSSKVEKTES